MDEMRMKFVLPKEESGRIRLEYKADGKPEVILDVHGLKCSQVKRIVNNLLNIAKAEFSLTVIHGYNHGTAIKEMLKEIKNTHIQNMYEDQYNPGRTHILAA